MFWCVSRVYVLVCKACVCSGVSAVCMFWCVRRVYVLVCKPCVCSGV